MDNCVQCGASFDREKTRRKYCLECRPVVPKISEPTTIFCARCGREEIRRGPVQKYCRECSATRDVDRKLEWYKKNYPNRVPKQRDITELTRKRREHGVIASSENKVTVTWPMEELDIVHSFRFCIPYTKVLSKNAIYSMARGGSHVYIREQAKAAREEITYRIKATREEWFHGKVWLDIFVEKPDARSDAINVVDSIADAVKVAIGIDDRWFSIRRLDWSIVKDNPRIWIGIGQEVTEHHRICSFCGSVKTLDLFSKNKSDELGVGRVCRECSTSVRKSNRDTSLKLTN